jgi:sulfate adenylyltransferase subunit 1
MNLLRFTTAGSVDDGKSTLIGRLLYDSKSVYIDQMESVERTSRRKGLDKIDFSLLSDGLKDEREQGITIDVAYRYFSTPARKFIIADTPGHIQYTRNMVTGASSADAGLILIDARQGVVEQTRRHSFISGLLGIPSVMVCINKMDLVDFDQKHYDQIVSDFEAVKISCNLKSVEFIPISALLGDNIVDTSKNMPWYNGPTLLNHLETVKIDNPALTNSFRMPIQNIIRPHSSKYHDYRGYSGRIASGQISLGDLITIYPSKKSSIVKGILRGDLSIEKAITGDSVSISLKDDIDISRGDVLCTGDDPSIEKKLDATICWLDNEPQRLGSKYILRQGTNESNSMITEIKGVLNVHTLDFKASKGPLTSNEIAQISLKSTKVIVYDSYSRNRITGSFILIDNVTGSTVAAGMIS